MSCTHQLDLTPLANRPSTSSPERYPCVRHRVMKLLTALPVILGLPACSDFTEALGLTADSDRSLVGNTIIFDDFAAGQCGINEIEVTVTGGSYSDSDVTKSVPGDLTGIRQGYWIVENVPTGTTVTVTTTDSHGQLQPASRTVLVETVTENIGPPQVVEPIPLSPARPGVRCFCAEGEGRCEENLTRNAVNDLYPAWSPDGGRIAFSSAREITDGLGLYVMNADGSGVALVGDEEGVFVRRPTWSPDGERIAFAADLFADFDIFVTNTDGTGAVQLTSSRDNEYFPDWSPDGGTIAFTSDRYGNDDIYVMNADGTGVVRLTNHAADDWDPAWSPDGRRIVFASRRDGSRNIFVMNADGTGVTRLSSRQADDWDPAWSPDGRRIVFTSRRDDNNMDIYVMNAGGTGVTRLTNNAANDFDPAWSPDGGRIAYTSRRDGNADIFVLSAPE